MNRFRFGYFSFFSFRDAIIFETRVVSPLSRHHESLSSYRSSSKRRPRRLTRRSFASRREDDAACHDVGVSVVPPRDVHGVSDEVAARVADRRGDCRFLRDRGEVDVKTCFFFFSEARARASPQRQRYRRGLTQRSRGITVVSLYVSVATLTNDVRQAIC